jgi:DNA modification methylase
MTNVINQSIGDGYALYHADCVEGYKAIPDNSVDYSIFSPPFSSLYTYSNSDRDMGNSKGDEEFWAQYRYLIAEQFRAHKPGRLISVHCMLLPASLSHDGYIGLKDFRGDIIRAYQDAGFIFHSEVVIWKDPVTAMQRTKALGLLYKQIKKDSARSRQGVPDYLVTFRKPGVNPDPVTKDPEVFPVDLWQKEASPVWTYGDDDPPLKQFVDWVRGFFSPVSDFGQRFPDPVWMDINQSETLQYRSAREHNDERHICPLQLEVIRRGIRLWTNEGDTVVTPFAGIGSELVTALEMGRRAVGFELKKSYYEQAARNCAAAEQRTHQPSLFDLLEAA